MLTQLKRSVTHTHLFDELNLIEVLVLLFIMSAF